MRSPQGDVSLIGVRKTFGATVAVDHVDLDIPNAAVFSLLGPSGCGKTTTLRLIAGFEQPSAGDVFIREKRVTDVPPYKRDFAMVFQSYALFPHLTVADNVGFGLRMRKVGRAERDKAVREVLALVKLEALAERYPRQLSGGQQQRVALARAIVVKPAVLLLDEPLGALDKLLREEMQVELRDLQRRLGITAVFVTHDQEEALTISDVVAVMRNGVIEQLGSPREIYERPRTEFVAGFLGASNFVDGEVAGREGENAVVMASGRRLLQSDPSGAASGKVRIAVRPERVLLGDPGDDGIPGRVTHVIYRGSVTQFHVAGETGAVIIYVQNSSPEAQRFKTGDAVTYSWEAGSGVVLAQGAA
jgi:putative spermidine/putrescine transport system ATP-binding protein/spermidine/putrescine transport system ATP-binding protein